MKQFVEQEVSQSIEFENVSIEQIFHQMSLSVINGYNANGVKTNIIWQNMEGNK